MITNLKLKNFTDQEIKRLSNTVGVIGSSSFKLTTKGVKKKSRHYHFQKNEYAARFYGVGGISVSRFCRFSHWPDTHKLLKASLNAVEQRRFGLRCCLGRCGLIRHQYV